MRRRAKRDRAETEIVAALRKLGWFVEYLSIPNGPDLLLGRSGNVTRLAEVKTGTAKLKPGQARWHENWQGHPVVVLRDVADAVELTVRVTGTGAP